MQNRVQELPMHQDEIKILMALDKEPRRWEFFLVNEIADKANFSRHLQRELVYYNASQAIFMITHAGVAQLRARGMKAGRIAWKDDPFEMSADRAIALFAGKDDELPRPKSGPSIKKSNEIHPK